MAYTTFPQIGAIPQLQRQLNKLVGELNDNAPGYGVALPPAEGNEGRLFRVTGTNKLYQLVSGAWVAIT